MGRCKPGRRVASAGALAVSLVISALVGAASAHAGEVPAPVTDGYVVYGQPLMQISCSGGAPASAEVSFAFDATRLSRGPYPAQLGLIISDPSGSTIVTYRPSLLGIGPGSSGGVDKFYPIPPDIPAGSSISAHVTLRGDPHHYRFISAYASLTCPPRIAKRATRPAAQVKRVDCNGHSAFVFNASSVNRDFAAIATFPGGRGPGDFVLQPISKYQVTTFPINDAGALVGLTVEIRLGTLGGSNGGSADIGQFTFVQQAGCDGSLAS